MFILDNLKQAWIIISDPQPFFQQKQTEDSYKPLTLFYFELLLIITILTPIVNFFGFPSDIVHAGTNAQMGAYLYAPTLENVTSISRYIWVALITFLGNAVKLPVLGLIFHGFAKIMGGDGDLLASFKVAVYSTAPMLLFGWIPYFGLLSGLWTGYLYVLAYHELHHITFGKAIVFINLMIGIQLVYTFVTGAWLIQPQPW